MPVRSVGEPQARAKGNHDNPMSGNPPGTVTLNTQWNIEYLPILTKREGRDEESFFLRLYTQHNTSRNGCHQLGSCILFIKFLKGLSSEQVFCEQLV